ncbi:hypothetical protein HHI36_017558, partial [Cryptolaemus montrouzieri]
MNLNNKMNLLIDLLRQDSCEENLQKSLEQIKATISTIDTLIQSHLKDETAVVEKFHQLGLTNVDILRDELERFIKQFVPPPDADPRIMKKRASWMDVDELKTQDHLFSKQFLNCRFLMQAIDNWQFGVWQGLITFMDTAKGVITKELTQWADNEKRILSSRSELKMKFNNVRIEMIKEDLCKVR